MIFKFVKKVLMDAWKSFYEFLMGIGVGLLIAFGAVASLGVIGFLLQWIPGFHIFFPAGKSHIPGYITIGFGVLIIGVLGYSAISYLRTTWKELKAK